MQTVNKTLHIGTTRDSGNLFCRVRFDGRKLSIKGVEGPLANGGCRGSCGQIVMQEWDLKSYAPGWTSDLVAQFRAVWDRWHLNDLTAGTPAQEEWLRANPAHKRNDYPARLAALTSAGLNPDPSNGYVYGSAWLLEEVPQDVVAFLAGLPDSTLTPAWI